MRDIKFRAWDGEKMYYDVQNSPHEWSDGYNCDGTGKHESFKQVIDNMEVMQYTGLKDKNGVEIYEGDIIGNIDYPMKYNYEVRFSNEQYGGVYGWLYFHKGETVEYYYGEGPKEGEGEIIGNIYENPNLLTK